MSHDRTEQRLQIHPAKYFEASPTWHHWCKLTASDVHALREERGFEGQNVFFYLNHPIRYITLVGPITTVDDIPNSTFTVLTLDDGSGTDINLRLQSINKVNFGTTAVKDVKNMTIRRGIGEFIVFIDSQSIEVGTVVKVKGIISSFRGTRQIDVKRIWIVKDTSEEAENWRATADFKTTVLAKPWILTREDRKRVDQDIEDGYRRERKRQRKEDLKKLARVKYEQEKQKKREERDVRAEKRRQVLEREMNVGAIV